MSAPNSQRISVDDLIDEITNEVGPRSADAGHLPVETMVFEGLENAVECNLTEHFTEDDVLLLTLRPRLADQVRRYVREVTS